MATWQVRLLGTEQLARTDVGSLEMPDVWWPVLGCLLVAPGFSITRSALSGRLWPDKDQQSARHCLASALWRIKSRLPFKQSLLRFGTECIALSIRTRDWVDTLAFERRTKAALAAPQRLTFARERLRLRRALALYRGAYLEERDEEWIAIERERLRTLYLDASFILALAETEASNWEAARTTAQALCVAEPFREDAQRLLMTAYLRTGNRALALSQYQSLVRLLDSELDIAPMFETQELAERIRAGTASPSPAPTGGADRGLILHARDHLVQSLDLITESLNA